MTVLFDKETDSNIKSIICGEVNANIFKWCLNSVPSHVIDTENFEIKIGAIDTTIKFESLESMQPYIQTYDNFNTIHNPITDGIPKDPHYDKIPTGHIESHTYVDTDIEQDLINN